MGLEIIGFGPLQNDETARLYRHHGISVADGKFVGSNWSIPTAHIAAIRYCELPASRAWPNFFIAVGALWLVLATLIAGGTRKLDLPVSDISLALVFFNPALVVGLIWRIRRRPIRHWLSVIDCFGVEWLLLDGCKAELLSALVRDVGTALVPSAAAEVIVWEDPYFIITSSRFIMPDRVINLALVSRAEERDVDAAPAWERGIRLAAAAAQLSMISTIRLATGAPVRPERHALVITLTSGRELNLLSYHDEVKLKEVAWVLNQQIGVASPSLPPETTHRSNKGDGSSTSSLPHYPES
jgi:hypothetical protein